MPNNEFEKALREIGREASANDQRARETSEVRSRALAEQEDSSRRTADEEARTREAVLADVIGEVRSALPDATVVRAQEVRELQVGIRESSFYYANGTFGDGALHLYPGQTKYYQMYVDGYDIEVKGKGKIFMGFWGEGQEYPDVPFSRSIDPKLTSKPLVFFGTANYNGSYLSYSKENNNLHRIKGTDSQTMRQGLREGILQKLRGR